MLATVNSGWSPVESAIARLACAASSSPATRGPACWKRAKPAKTSAPSTPTANNATAVGRSGSRPPISASKRSRRYPAGAIQAIAGSNDTAAFGPPQMWVSAPIRTMTGSRTSRNGASPRGRP